jgi:hypothetical protein
VELSRRKIEQDVASFSSEINERNDEKMKMKSSGNIEKLKDWLHTHRFLDVQIVQVDEHYFIC